MLTTRLRASVLCVDKGKLLMVRFEDPVTKRLYLFPPGGKIEDGETAEAAAERETREETGYAVRVDPSSLYTLHYPFQWAGKSYDCTTHFFRATLISDEQVGIQEEESHRGVNWIPIANVAAEFSYHPQLSQTVAALLASASSQKSTTTS